MEKKVYIDILFTNRREKLIERCLGLQEKGKGFLYIMPSSAAIFQVRERLNALLGGFLGSRVIVFDDLELDIVKDKLKSGRIIYDQMDRILISAICSNVRDRLKYFNRIYNKKGFHQEVSSFIRSLKRGCISEGELQKIQESIGDEVLSDKLADLHLLYSEYNRSLKERELYDRNDLSLKAVEIVKEYRGFEGIDTIVIDGFTDIDPVNMALVRGIAGLEKANIIVSTPYENEFNKDFLRVEIEEPFTSMGFELIREKGELSEVNNDIREICYKLFTGERLNESIKGLTLYKYPCIEAEVRETARSIKERLIEGESPENIAVYVNNSEDYSKDLTEIFKEFGIPISLGKELTGGSSELVRKIIKGFVEREEKELKLSEWLELLDKEIEGLGDYMTGLLKKALDERIDITDKLEIKSIDALRRISIDAEYAFTKSYIIDEVVSSEYFMNYILDRITGETFTLEEGNNRGVRIFNTSLAKGVYFNHVYILGLNDGEIPSAVKGTGIFDSVEAEKLKGEGIRFRDFMWELTRDKIRFNLAISSARNTVTLSYRGAGENGGFAIPSSFIDEVKFLTGIVEERNYTMRDRFERDLINSMSKDELKRGFIRSYFRNKYRGIQEPQLDFHVSTPEIIKTGMVEYHREREGFFNEYEGVIGDEFREIAHLLGKFSPSALKNYLDCPFKYMVTNLYKPGEPEVEEDFSALEIGNLYHQVLFGYYTNLRQFETFNEELFIRIFNDAFEGMRKTDMLKNDIDRKRIEAFNRLKNFLELDLERFKTYERESGGRVLRPNILEQFMVSEDSFDAPVNSKIDRVDLEYKREGEELIPTGRYVIYDYKKSGMSDMSKILQNGDYQLTVYYYLVEDYLRKQRGIKETECLSLLYMSIEETEKKNKTRKKQQIEVDGIYKTEYKKALSVSKQWDIAAEHFPLVLKYVKGLINGTINEIKSGKFNYKPMCNHYEGYEVGSCEYKRLCRYSRNKMRSLTEEGL